MMDKAQSMDQEPVRLRTNLAGAGHRGFAGDVVLLPAELAARLVAAGFADPVVEEGAEPKAKSKGKGK